MRQKVKIVLRAVLPSAFFLLTAAVMVGAAEILGEILAFMEELPLLGHQIQFDYGFLHTG